MAAQNDGVSEKDLHALTVQADWYEKGDKSAEKFMSVKIETVRRLMHEVKTGRESAALYIENNRQLWGKNLANSIREGKHLSGGN